MGSGKGYVMRWMSQNQVFPVESVVKIDPDHFKAAMPEWGGYLQQDRAQAGTLCHRESGFIQELCQEVSLRSRQNTWIDGSLGDSAWWSEWIAEARRRLPWYRIAIFYVYCTPAQVVARAQQRGRATGRYVPEASLRHSIDATAEAVKVLGPLADFLAIINNSA